MSAVVTVVSSKWRGVASLRGRTWCRKVGSGCPAAFRLLLSCRIPGQALLESLGEQGRGVCSFLCRRTLPPLWCRALSWGLLLPAQQGLCVRERRGPGYLGLHSTSILGSGHPSLLEGALHSEACWLRALPCPGLLNDCFIGGSYLFSR